jgi:hypothetical protein
MDVYIFHMDTALNGGESHELVTTVWMYLVTLTEDMTLLPRGREERARAGHSWEI